MRPSYIWDARFLKVKPIRTVKQLAIFSMLLRAPVLSISRAGYGPWPANLTIISYSVSRSRNSPRRFLIK